MTVNITTSHRAFTVLVEISKRIHSDSGHFMEPTCYGINWKGDISPQK